MSKKTKILVVGQTPPPYGGQAVMIDFLLKGNYGNIELYHSRMAFSKEMNEVGKPSLFKVSHLFGMIFDILLKKFKHKIPVLYFPPTGPNRLPFYRDALLLVAVRPFFRKTIFHFHAAGISDLYPELDIFSKLLFRLAYYHADIGIRLSPNSANDCSKLKVKLERIIPNGIEDNYHEIIRAKNPGKVCSILFVGLLTEKKGIQVLIEACGILKSQGIEFNVNVMGKFESTEFESKVKSKASEYGLDLIVNFLGVVVGKEKFKVYSNSDIFCFPSFFDAENFPVVLLEASSFALPIVSSQWRGIPSIVIEGQNGYLAPIHDSKMVAEKLALLIASPEMRTRMGQKSRELYLEKYSLTKFYENMGKLFSLLT